MNEQDAIEDLLYAIGMESQIAHENMQLLCRLLNVNFPPEKKVIRPPVSDDFLTGV